MPPPQLPADEPLQGGIRFIDQRPAASLAELTGLVKVERLVIVEQIAFAVVSGCTARLLIAELRASLNGQRLESEKTREF